MACLQKQKQVHFKYKISAILFLNNAFLPTFFALESAGSSLLAFLSDLSHVFSLINVLLEFLSTFFFLCFFLMNLVFHHCL